jgi:hypothetical protein
LWLKPYGESVEAVSRTGRVIGNSQSEARIGSFIFQADPSLRLVTDYSPLGRRNSHYADRSWIRPRNGSPARIGLKPAMLPLTSRPPHTTAKHQKRLAPRDSPILFTLASSLVTNISVYLVYGQASAHIPCRQSCRPIVCSLL